MLTNTYSQLLNQIHRHLPFFWLLREGQSKYYILLKTKNKMEKILCRDKISVTNF